MSEQLSVLDELERRLIVGCYGEPGRRRPASRWLRWPLAAVGPIVTAAGVTIAVVALSAGTPPSASRAARVALDRAAAAATAVTQPAFGPGEFWYTRSLQSSHGPGLSVRSTVETWFGFDGTSRTRSAPPARSVSGQDSVTVGHPDYGPGDGVGFSAALFSNAQLASLPTDVAQLRAAIDAAQRAFSRQQNALKIEVQRPAGSSTSQIVLRSNQSASQRRALELFETAGALLAAPVSPGVRGALYRLIANVPGLRYDGELHDPLGRVGTAVSIGHGRDGARILFDPLTGELLSDSLDGVLTQTIIADGFTSSLGSLPSGLTPVGGDAPAILLATVSPQVGAALTVFHVVQSTRKAPMEDTLQGPTARSCKAELFPGPSPRLAGGGRTTSAIGGLGGLAYRYSFGPAAIDRRAWCPGQYQLQVTGVSGRQATAYFYVK